MQKITSFPDLCELLKNKNVKVIYLIHEEFREREARLFASKIMREGFKPIIACDCRIRGEKAVRGAIKNSDFCIVLAYDDETVKKAEELSVPFITLFK